MWKTGPLPSWYTPWRKRLFVLKGNFLFYFDAVEGCDDPQALGAIYLKNAIIEKDSMPFASHVLTISPIVKRRPNWEGSEESSIFHLKFKTNEDRSEVNNYYSYMCHCYCSRNDFLCPPELYLSLPLHFFFSPVQWLTVLKKVAFGK